MIPRRVCVSVWPVWRVVCAVCVCAVAAQPAAASGQADVVQCVRVRKARRDLLAMGVSPAPAPAASMPSSSTTPAPLKRSNAQTIGSKQGSVFSSVPALPTRPEDEPLEDEPQWRLYVGCFWPLHVWKRVWKESQNLQLQMQERVNDGLARLVLV